jgi:(1->4)-alpha-D-glucan 1-alpha-D-glucosylmutase
MVPLATYRLQFNSKFRFRDAIGILDYLRDLGISHVYASPLLTSRHGSGHGYDVTDPTKIDPHLGGDEDFALLQSALEERDMGLVLDIVPNHMAASAENRWWMDVLEYGPDSPFASYFDIDWKPPSRGLENKLLLPFLSKPFAGTLNDGDLHLRYRDGKLHLEYFEQVFPIAPKSYAEILEYVDEGAKGQAESDSPAAQEWQGIFAAARKLAADSVSHTQTAAERRTRFENTRDRLKQLLTSSPQIADQLESALTILNGVPGEPSTFSKLERILSSQHYRLAFWQTVGDTINYRRFFSITDLVGVRVEDPPVFDATHQLALQIGQKKVCGGFRIDHIDGLRDPYTYLTRIRERLSAGRADPYLVVEKILGKNEWLPKWPVDGTTGYDYMNYANRLLVDGANAEATEKVYKKWIGLQVNFEDVIYDKKKLVMRTLLAVEMRALARELIELACDDRYARELHPAELAEALIEITACLPVYRTYIQTLEVPDAAREVVRQAIQCAETRRPTLAHSYFEFLAEVLLLAAADHVRPEQREMRLAFVTRWQQFTGSIMAKGFEDTALYVYYPLASLNEVGGDPVPRRTDPAEFHKFLIARHEKWPNSMNATTTHDTKRSEDTRARIAVLSEIPDRWESSLESWSRMNEKYAIKVDGLSVPDRNEEYLFYQTLVGTWPQQDDEWEQLIPRIQQYLIKATREANIHTRWAKPNEAHERGLREFVVQVLDRQQNADFCSNFAEFHKCVAIYGMLNGLSQTVLKIACPGVPDCYQGSELWDLRLVDPDNRGAIDYDRRRTALKMVLEEREQASEDMLASWPDGNVKLRVFVRSLTVRKNRPELFAKGRYLSLDASGTHAGRIVAFAREYQQDWAIVVLPRCVTRVKAPILGPDARREFWNDTILRLPEEAPSAWTNVLAGKGTASISSRVDGLSVGEIFHGFPAALLRTTL